jgi:hypothetical protein
MCSECRRCGTGLERSEGRSAAKVFWMECRTRQPGWVLQVAVKEQIAMVLSIKWYLRKSWTFDVLRVSMLRD